VASVPNKVTSGDIGSGDARLHLLEGEIDQLHVAQGLLGKHDVEVGHRDALLFDGLAAQIEDRRAATEQRHDAKGEAGCPELSARAENGAAGPCHGETPSPA
jgi:hypothetical protein